MSTPERQSARLRRQMPGCPARSCERAFVNVSGASGPLPIHARRRVVMQPQDARPTTARSSREPTFVNAAAVVHAQRLPPLGTTSASSSCSWTSSMLR
jgi:hypothetical protein